MHARLDALDAHHAERLDATVDACKEPATAYDLVPVLFNRTLDGHQMGFAMGEAMAHANHLMVKGRLKRERGADGVIRYQR